MNSSSVRFLVLAAVAVAVVGGLWLALRPATTPAGGPQPAKDAAAQAAGTIPALQVADEKPTAREQAQALLMDIPRDLPPLMVPGAPSPVLAEEIEDVPFRREVYGTSVPQVVGCIAAGGHDHKKLDPAFRARLVLAPGDSGTEVRDVVFLAEETAPPPLVKCFREALKRVHIPGPPRTGVVTTPPLGGERPPAGADAGP